ncbi:MAG: helix-turn-helix domain-containing protein [Spirochaetaceae bacterium]|nr:helix-turn-helix domain-containing protein [Spirochaetaceae bacterium]
MAKIGAQIQEIRLKKGLTLDRIADDTNISVRFLAKIENDDFTGFPGEPYIVGFIRNYAEYLGLDPEKVVAAYRLNDAVHEAETSMDMRRNKAKASRSGHAASDRKVQTQTEAKGADAGAEKPDITAEASPGSNSGATGAELLPAAGEPDTATGAGSDQANADSGQGRKRHFLGILLITIVAALLIWEAFRQKPSSQPPQDATEAKPVEYRVEGTPFEKRLYVGDSLIIPLGDDVFKAKLDSIDDTVNLVTPWGPFNLSLGQPATIDTNKDAIPDATITAADFEKNKPASGALLHLEISQTDTAAAQGEVTVPDSAKAGAEAKATTPAVLLRSSRGPYPFIVQVAFRGNCMFRYEADRKEWVEKYYFKGESITVNVNSSLTVWASNAQAAKLVFQASGGKTADLEMGSPGEIVVKKISWSQADGGWALVAANLD